MILCAYYLISTMLMVKAVTMNNPGANNIGIYDLLFLLTSVCIGSYFYLLLQTVAKKIVTVIICGVEGIYFILDSLIFNSSQLFDSNAYAMLSLGVVIMIFMYMHQLLSNISDEPLSSNFDFWLVSAQLIYHLGSFIIFLTFNYLSRKIMPAELYSSENRAVLTKLWGVHNVLLFLSTLLTIFGVLWISFPKKSPSSLWGPRSSY
jgi:hypothetical protein